MVTNHNSCFVDGAVRDIDYARVRLADGTVHDIDEGRVIGPDGQMHYFSFGFTPLNRQPIGTRVFAKAMGRREEFILVQKGKPDSPLYDDSSDGLWLLQTSAYDGWNIPHEVPVAPHVCSWEARHSQWFSYSDLIGMDSWEDAQDGNQLSFYRPYLSGMDPFVRDKLLVPKLPYTAGPVTVKRDTFGPVITLSAVELGLKYLVKHDESGVEDPEYPVPGDGVPLQYFSGENNQDEHRAAPAWQSPSYTQWYATRSSYRHTATEEGLFPAPFTDFAAVTTQGRIGRGRFLGGRPYPESQPDWWVASMRPCIILPKTTLLDKYNNIVAG